MKILLPTISLLAALTAGLPASAAETPKEGTLFKNPYCGCCSAYADYLRQNGYSIKVVPTEQMSMVKKSHGITEDMEACHTMVIDGYVVEGHVPVNIVDKLLSEHPDITGIYLPGMPKGSPGMGGEKEQAFKVYGFTNGKPEAELVLPFAIE